MEVFSGCGHTVHEDAPNKVFHLVHSTLTPTNHNPLSLSVNPVHSISRAYVGMVLLGSFYR